MGDQQAASPESPIFVSDVCSPSALSVLCVHGVLILMRACVGLGGQARGCGWLRSLSCRASSSWRVFGPGG